LVGIVLSRLIDKSKEKLVQQRQIVTGCLAAVLTIVLALDSFPKGLNLDLTTYKTQTSELDSWVNSIEEQTGGNCPILQLPVVSYPEMPPTLQMDIYEQFLPYLVSKNLKFTFGSMKDSKLSNWQSNLPNEIDVYLAEVAAGNGFCAIAWDSLGLSIEDLKKLKNVAQSLDLDIVQSISGRWGSVHLGPLSGKMSQKEKLKYKGILLDAPQFSVLKGLSGVEQDTEGLFSWATTSKVEMNVYNPSPNRIQYSLDFVLSSSPSGMKRLYQIDWQGKTKTFTLQQAGQRVVNLKINLDGDSEARIAISASGNPDSVPGDPRSFYFRLRNISDENNSSRILLR
jgi:hypothetical protein